MTPRQLPLPIYGPTIRSPLCRFDRHCGARAVLGAECVVGDAINVTVTCLTCGVTGTRSTNLRIKANAQASETKSRSAES